MEQGSLHPNLARIAAAYDQLTLSCSRGEVDLASVHTRIAELVARDDEGVMWRLDPESGGWLRATLSGTWVPGSPPTWGLATPTAHDLTPEHVRRAQLPGSDPAAYDPDTFITHTPVDLTKVGDGTLAGSTLRQLVRSGPSSDGGMLRNRLPVILLLSGCLVLLILVGLYIK